MNPKENMTPAEREDLVAYLDGELDDTAARALETRLDRNPVARAEAETLQRAWDLLDYLPKPEGPGTLSEQTVARLEVEKSRELTRRQRFRLLGWAGWGSTAAAAAAVGFILFYKPPPTAEEIRVVENLPLYEYVESMEFLEELAAAELFDEDW